MVRRRTASLALAILLLSSLDASAQVSFGIDVLWKPDPSDDTQVYLHASSVVYPARRQRIEAVYDQIQQPELDYPVLAFIACQAKADIRSVWTWRTKGHSWYDVMLHFSLPPDTLFVSLPAQPGRPYGKAYGYWKKRGNATTARYVSDDDVRFWVDLRTVASYAGIPVETVYERYQQGEKIRHIAGDYHRSELERNANARSRQKKSGRGDGPSGW